MSNPDFTKVARELINAYNASNWNAIKNISTPDVIYDEVGSQRRTTGPDAIVQTLQTWKKAMTDSSGNVTSVFSSGNMAAMQITWQGTHNGPLTGPMGTINPTGKHQTSHAAMIVKFQGEKVKEIHHYFDMLSFLSQIGAMPSMSARA